MHYTEIESPDGKYEYVPLSPPSHRHCPHPLCAVTTMRVRICWYPLSPFPVPDRSTRQCAKAPGPKCSLCAAQHINGPFLSPSWLTDCGALHGVCVLRCVLCVLCCVCVCARYHRVVDGQYRVVHLFDNVQTEDWGWSDQIIRTYQL